MNGVQRKAFSRPFCLGVTRKTGEAEESQRDGKETAKKSDVAKTRSWAGATPLFGPSVSKVTRGVAPAQRRSNQRRVFWPRRHKGREEKGLGKEKRESKNAKQFGTTRLETESSWSRNTPASCSKTMPGSLESAQKLRSMSWLEG